MTSAEQRSICFVLLEAAGIESSISDLQKLYPDMNIVDGKRLNDATETDIREWIESIN